MGGDGGYPQLGKAGAGEWCLKMVVSACQETDEARNGASSLASNPRKYREKKVQTRGGKLSLLEALPALYVSNFSPFTAHGFPTTFSGVSGQCRHYMRYFRTYQQADTRPTSSCTPNSACRVGS